MSSPWSSPRATGAIDARIVPYNKPTRVRGSGPEYLESWLPGRSRSRRGPPTRSRCCSTSSTSRDWAGSSARAPRSRTGATPVRHLPRAPARTVTRRWSWCATGSSPESRWRRWQGLPRTVEGGIERVRAHLDKVSLASPPSRTRRCWRCGADPGAGAGRACSPNQSPTQNPKSSWPGEAHPATGRRTGRRGEAAARAAEVDAVLERLGIERTLKRAISPRPWNGAPARFSDEQYQRSALVCRPGDDPPKMRCSLPVLEPNGDVNTNALGRPRPGSTRSRASPPPCAQLPRASSCACTGSATWRRRSPCGQWRR